MLHINRHNCGQIIIAFVAVILSQGALAKALSINIVDKNGAAVSNAVVSFPQFTATKQTTMAIMDQVDKQFDPYVLMVQKNQKVDFPNSDDVRHHVYSFSQPNQFEIKLFSGSDTQALTFKSEGIVVLGCNIHDNMIAYIYVNDGELTAMTDNVGQLLIELPENANSAQTIEVIIWHPELSPLQTQRVAMSLPSKIRSHNITLPFGLEIEKPDIDTGFKKKFGN